MYLHRYVCTAAGLALTGHMNGSLLWRYALCLLHRGLRGEEVVHKLTICDIAVQPLILKMQDPFHQGSSVDMQGQAGRLSGCGGDGLVPRLSSTC